MLVGVSGYNPLMPEFWVAVPGGEPKGPVDLDTLRTSYVSGRIPRQALACADGSSEWRPVEDVLKDGASPGSTPSAGALVHLALEDGQRRTVRAEDALKSLRSGQLNPDTTMCWVEGMEDWQVARVMFKIEWDRRGVRIVAEPERVSGHVLRSSGGGTYQLEDSPFGLALALQILYWISLPVSGVALLLVLRPCVELIDRARQGDTSALEELPPVLELGSKIEIIEVGLMLVTTVMFFIWFHRIVVNCVGFGAQGMRFSPGASVGWFFVPVVNLWFPKQAMDEACRVSTDPANWQSVRSPALVGVWWGLLIANLVLAVRARWFLHRFEVEVENGTDNAWSVWDSVVLYTVGSYATGIGLTICSILLVSSVTKAQRRLTRGVVVGH